MENEDLDNRDEIAEIHAIHDMEEMREHEELERALSLYEEMRELANNGGLSLLNVNKALPVLEEVERILSHNEMYEKCQDVLVWRRILTDIDN